MDKNGFSGITKIRQKWFSNHGFSLIELIIVIAIMAILVGVIAPNLLRYIERANISADIQLADSIRTAVKLAMIDPETAPDVGDGVRKWLYLYGSWRPDDYDIDSIPIIRKDGADTPFGAAIAETLGYPDVASMVVTSTGIGSQLRFADDHQIIIHFEPIDNFHEVYIQIDSSEYDYSFYVCLPECLPGAHRSGDPLPPGHKIY